MSLNQGTMSYMQVNHGGFNFGMSQQVFDSNDIQSIFNQMCSVRMTKGRTVTLLVMPAVLTASRITQAIAFEE